MWIAGGAPLTILSSTDILITLCDAPRVGLQILKDLNATSRRIYMQGGFGPARSR